MAVTKNTSVVLTNANSSKFGLGSNLTKGTIQPNSVYKGSCAGCGTCECSCTTKYTCSCTSLPISHCSSGCGASNVTKIV